MDWKRQINVENLTCDSFNDIISLLKYIHKHLEERYNDTSIELPYLLKDFTFEYIVKILGISCEVTSEGKYTNRFIKRINSIIARTKFIIEGINSHSNDLRWLARCKQHIVYINNWYAVLLANENTDKSIDCNDMLRRDTEDSTVNDIKFCIRGYKDILFTSYNPYKVKLNYYASLSLYSISTEDTILHVLSYHNISVDDYNLKENEGYDTVLLKDISKQIETMRKNIDYLTEACQVLLADNNKLNRQLKIYSDKSKISNSKSSISKLNTDRLHVLINIHIDKDKDEAYYLSSITNRIKYIRRKLKEGYEVDKKTGMKYIDIISELQSYIPYFTT